ncbi:MAG: hypothetical protein GTN81_12430 [Proteobacteria bacterium]|nr:hypothetical protein [Pseudomonadota bacterium]
MRFFRCTGCRRVCRGDQGQDFCPTCGGGTETEGWPDPPGQRLFEAVAVFSERGDRDLTVILACDLLEGLLEMFFRDLFRKQGKPRSWIQLTFKKNKSLDLRLKYLFKETMNLSFPSVIEGTAFEGFDKRWAAIRSVRGQIFHTIPPAASEKGTQEAYDLSREALALFAWMNNRYCV